jgi:hypothetical protein
VLGKITIRELGLLTCIAGVSNADDPGVSTGLKQVGMQVLGDLEDKPMEEQNDIILQFIEMAGNAIAKFNEIKLKCEEN